MAWFLHVVEVLDGRWVRRRSNDIDHHPTLEAALEHIGELARGDPPAESFVHHLSGDTHRFGEV
jgi:hypothetical protein